MKLRPRAHLARGPTERWSWRAGLRSRSAAGENSYRSSGC